MFKSLFSKIFKTVGSMNGSGSGSACWHLWFDEPVMPKSMIEK